jgi:hypothetical protein
VRPGRHDARRPPWLRILGALLDRSPNGIGGGGSCFPSSVTVALAEPGTPVICWARTALAANNQATVNAAPPVIRYVELSVLS